LALASLVVVVGAVLVVLVTRGLIVVTGVVNEVALLVVVLESALG
jgi:hypothetical protein